MVALVALVGMVFGVASQNRKRREAEGGGGGGGRWRGWERVRVNTRCANRERRDKGEAPRFRREATRPFHS